MSIAAVVDLSGEGADRSEAGIIADLAPIASRYRKTIEAGDDFQIKTLSGGLWVGSDTLVRDAPALAVRTFIDG